MSTAFRKLFMLTFQGAWNTFLNSSMIGYGGSKRAHSGSEGLSFLTPSQSRTIPRGIRYRVLDSKAKFVSCDGFLCGFRQLPDESQVVLFHFWGCREKAIDIWNAFYRECPRQDDSKLINREAKEILRRYRYDVDSSPD